MTPQQLKWIEALESGNYPQDKGNLKKDGKFCCLGVACELFGKELGVVEEEISGMSVYDNTSCALPPESVAKHLGLLSIYGDGRDRKPSLVNLNDNGKTFKEIAALLRNGDYFDTPTA